MSWDAEAEELRRRRALAQELGGAERVARHHADGKLTVRERIERLVDKGSFQEFGALTGAAAYVEGRLEKITPAPYVMGLARIDGRVVAIGGEDFTVRGGSSPGLDRRKGGQGGLVEDLAHEYRVPLVNLVDGAGGWVRTVARTGHAHLPGVDTFGRSVQLLARVPVLGAVLGSSAGGPAARAVLSHFSVMVEGTSHVFSAGPAVAERALGERLTKDELGGADVAVDAGGAIHNRVRSEEEAFAQVRRVLAYLPSNVWELPPGRRPGATAPPRRCQGPFRAPPPVGPGARGRARAGTSPRRGYKTGRHPRGPPRGAAPRTGAADGAGRGATAVGPGGTRRGLG